MPRSIPSRSAVRRLAADTSGAALVEFAITLPIMLLLFGVIIEGSRMMWSYQATITGVRDATRYVARIVSTDICNGGAALDTYPSISPTSLKRRVETSAGTGMFPPRVTVNSVSRSVACIAGSAAAYRNDPAPVATVSANVTIEFPFAGFFTLVGGNLSDRTTTVTDESRIFGS